MIQKYSVSRHFSRPGAGNHWASRPSQAPSSLLFAAFAAAVILRFSISGNILNLFEHYSSLNPFETSGTIIEKIHPGSYGIIAVAILMFPRIVSQWASDPSGLMRSMAAIAAAVVAVIVICLFTKNTNDIGYLFDAVFIAGVTGAVALCFDEPQRRFLGNALLVVIIVSSVMAIIEFFAKTHFIPRETDLPGAYEGGYERAAGLFDHPLSLGLFNAVAIPIVTLTNWSRLSKTVVIVILMLGIFAAGARTAAIAAIGMAVFALILPKGPRFEITSFILNVALVIAALAVLIPAAWLGLSAFGLTERFQNGLIDDSAMARILVFQIFQFIDWGDLIWGMGNAAMYKLSEFGLNLLFVENSLIIWIFQFGLIGAGCLIAALLYTLYSLARHTRIQLKLALGAFLLLAMTNNELSTKSPALLLIFILAIAFRSPVAVEGSALSASGRFQKRGGPLSVRAGRLSDA
jgi:hypothetical protein